MNYTQDTRFIKYADFTLLREGPMSNAKFDPGGLTKYGLAQNMHPELDIRNITKEQALQVYYTDYYLASGADKPPFDLGLAIFECAVNQGLGRSVRFAQEVLGLKIDGQAGSMTKAALSAVKPGSEVVALFQARRVKAYVELKDVNPDLYNTNQKGWFKRMFLCAAVGAVG